MVTTKAARVVEVLVERKVAAAMVVVAAEATEATILQMLLQRWSQLCLITPKGWGVTVLNPHRSLVTNPTRARIVAR